MTMSLPSDPALSPRSGLSSRIISARGCGDSGNGNGTGAAPPLPHSALDSSTAVASCSPIDPAFRPDHNLSPRRHCRCHPHPQCRYHLPSSPRPRRSALPPHLVPAQTPELGPSSNRPLRAHDAHPPLWSYTGPALRADPRPRPCPPLAPRPSAIAPRPLVSAVRMLPHHVAHREVRADPCDTAG
ncbi:hypothetical protein EHS25_005861 [Saitozyma podzolica]|uniref:Uncharacterized protein n=1 Tax=Saitozyma podzolica TaxID=1890683 RepID=A0A427XVV5_9TREE|nr:hypothetical protein EHS25_005861 [Saitozyma podzolica]